MKLTFKTGVRSDMQKKFTTLTLLVLLTGIPLSVGARETDDFSKLDRSAAAYLKKTDLSGAAVLIVRRDGAVLHEQFYGDYNQTTQVSIASASKWLAGALIMALVDAEKLKLDDPVSGLLPAFRTSDKSEITLRQLFNHTSGLPDGKLDKQDAPYLREASQNIAKLNLEFPPGSGFLYGGASMQAAGRVAEIAGKDTWHGLFESYIATPLEMKNTRFGGSDTNFNPQIAGGARSTLRDYARFLLMILNEGELDGVRVLSEQAVEEMLTDRVGKVEVFRATPSRRKNFPGYGVGCWTEEKGTSNQGIVVSSPGAFGFYPWIDRDRGIAAIWMIEDREKVRNDRKNLPDMKAEILRAVDSSIPVKSHSAPP